jgi:tetratricopeptide (TPR) repeat protein
MNLNPSLAEPHYYRGSIFYEKNDSVSAVNEYGAALRLNPQDHRTYTARGIARAKLGDTVGALADFEAAIAITADPAAYYHRGQLKVTAGDCAGAVADFDKAMALEPQFREHYKREPAC